MPGPRSKHVAGSAGAWWTDNQRRADRQRVIDVAAAIDRIVAADALDRDAVAALCRRETYATACRILCRALGTATFHTGRLTDAAMIAGNGALRAACELRVARAFLEIPQMRQLDWRAFIEGRDDIGTRRARAVLGELAWQDADADARRAVVLYELFFAMAGRGRSDG